MLLSELFQPNQIDWLVRRTVRSYGMAPKEINNGWCMAFAQKLAKRLGPNAKVIHTTGMEGVFPGHSVVLYQGRYFDAESPEGVTDPKDLNYSKRMYRIRDGKDTPEDRVTPEYDPRR